MSFDDGKGDAGDAAPSKAKMACCGPGDVDNPSPDIGPAVVDSDDHAFPIPQICDTHLCSERKGPVGGCQLAWLEPFSARGVLALPIIRGDAGGGVCTSRAGRERHHAQGRTGQDHAFFHALVLPAVDDSLPLPTKYVHNIPSSGPAWGNSALMAVFWPYFRRFRLSLAEFQGRYRAGDDFSWQPKWACRRRNDGLLTRLTSERSAARLAH